jgi:hypothetical protein
LSLCFSSSLTFTTSDDFSISESFDDSFPFPGTQPLTISASFLNSLALLPSPLFSVSEPFIQSQVFITSHPFTSSSSFQFTSEMTLSSTFPQEPPKVQSKPPLSTGTVAGIVGGVFAALLAIIAAWIYLNRSSDLTYSDHDCLTEESTAFSMPIDSLGEINLTAMTQLTPISAMEDAEDTFDPDLDDSA